MKMLLDVHREYGDIVRVKLGPFLTHLLVEPSNIDHVLRENSRNYVRGQLYERFKLFFGEGLLTSDNEYWKAHRVVVQPVFHKERIAALTDSMVDATEQLLTRFDAAARLAQPIDILPEMMRVSLAVLTRGMFGFDASPMADAIGPPVETAIEAMMPQTTVLKMLPSWVPTAFNRRVSRAQRALKDAVNEIIRIRRETKGQGIDLITLLLDAQSATGGGLSDQEVHDEVMTILLAGHETTGTGLAWALHALTQHPEVLRRLRSELDQRLGARGPTLADLAELPYLTSVVEETLRLYPPIWGFTRDALADDEVGGVRIPAGSSVFLCPYVTHRHSRLWDNPEAFDPERFMSRERRAPFVYFPFGGGQRQCIGNNMALLQMKIIIAMVARRFDLQMAPGSNASFGTVVSLRPVQGLRMAIRRRNMPGGLGGVAPSEAAS
jgi:cytochrome P450